MSSKAIEVRIWGQSAGAVALDPNLGYYVFAYTPEWLKAGIELAPRTMPVADYSGPYVFTNLGEATYHRLPAMLADALPDAFGHALINAYLLSHGKTLESISPLDRLAYMGKRGMGALEFKPALGTRVESRDALKMQSLVEAARAAVRGEFATEATTLAALNRIISVGSSAGGARAKAVIAWNPGTEEIRSGQFDVDPGFEHWILKFDGVGHDPMLGAGNDFGRMEYAYFLMARAAGIGMMDCRLLQENGRAHFMTRRFDREGNEKHHLQSLCAMEHMDFKFLSKHSYAQAFMAISALGLGREATDELFRRMAFNVMARNYDDHTKNLAFLLRKGCPWALAPAYDLTYAFNPAGTWTFQHQMSVNGKFKDITRADLLLDAERFGVRSPVRSLERVADALGSFDQFASEAGIPGKKAESVQRQFLRL